MTDEEILEKLYKKFPSGATEQYKVLVAYKEGFNRLADLEKENSVLKKALNLYVDWADECGIAWDNFPDMTEKWYKIVEEKGLGWIDGLAFMAIEEAKERLAKEAKE